jgi:hypothetical protein
MTVLEALLLVFLVLSVLVNVGLGIFSYFLYKAAARKTQEKYELMDLITAVAQYVVQSTSFLQGELARNIGNSEAPNYLELKVGLSDLRDKLRLFAGLAEDMRKSSSEGG